MAAGAAATIYVPAAPVAGNPDDAVPTGNFGSWGSNNNGTPWIPALSVSYNAGNALLAQAGQQAALVGVIQPAAAVSRGTAIYDPIAGTWTMKAPMSVARAAHTLTKLPDGRVLAVGGSTNHNDKVTGPHMHASAEVYDPALDIWTSIAPMPAVSDVVACESHIRCQQYGTPMAARSHHTTDVLPTNKVLVAGGYGSFIKYVYDDNINPRASALLLDLATMMWTQTAGMGIGTSTPNGASGLPVCTSYATLRGRAGHESFRMADGSVVVAGGVDNSEEWASTRVVQRFNPWSESWERLADLPAFEIEVLTCPIESPLVGFMAPRVVGASSGCGIVLAGRGGEVDKWFATSYWSPGAPRAGGHEGENRSFMLWAETGEDLDGDGLGDACDTDDDADGFADTDDICPREVPALGLDADHNGCTDTLAGLITIVQGLSLDSKVKNGLLGKLEEAEKALQRDNVLVVTRKLQDFISQVNGQRGSGISIADADLLSAYASNLITLLTT